MAVRIAVDAMGGDFAPQAIVQGVALAASQYSDIEVLLVGDEKCIESSLASEAADFDRSRITIIHTEEVIPMAAAPVEALRKYKKSSMARMAALCKEGEADAMISAGNTGAFAAVAQLTLRPLPQVKRPGIAVTIPSFYGPFVLCDVGANIQAKPQHLHEYAIMAGVFAERLLDIEKPRVALISTGEERGKGTGLIKQTYELLSQDASLNFIGNAEGRELFEDRCDVAICDGFVGNIILKFVEGLAEGFVRTIKREVEDEPEEIRGKFLSAIDRVWARHDYSRYGGAPLLGINGVCIICHGRSNRYAISNAIGVAKRFVERDINGALVSRLAQAN